MAGPHHHRGDDHRSLPLNLMLALKDGYYSGHDVLKDQQKQSGPCSASMFTNVHTKHAQDEETQLAESTSNRMQVQRFGRHLLYSKYRVLEVPRDIVLTATSAYVCCIDRSSFLFKVPVAALRQVVGRSAQTEKPSSNWP